MKVVVGVGEGGAGGEGGGQGCEYGGVAVELGGWGFGFGFGLDPSTTTSPCQATQGHATTHAWRMWLPLRHRGAVGVVPLPPSR